MSRPKRPERDRLLEAKLAAVNREGKIVQSRTPASIAGVDDRVAAGQGDLERLLDDHVLAGPGGRTAGSMWAPLGVQTQTTSRPGWAKHARRGRRRPCSRRRPARSILAPFAALRLQAATHPGAGDLVDRPGVKLCDHAAADDAEAVLIHRSFAGLTRRCDVWSDEADAGDLALADADDQAVAHVDQELGIGDRLAAGVETDADTALLDHATGIGAARFQPQLLDQDECGQPAFGIELVGIEADFGDDIRVFAGGPAAEFERGLLGGFGSVVLRRRSPCPEPPWRLWG